MNMSNFRPDLHVALQRRRDKLRYGQQQLHLDAYNTSDEILSAHQALDHPDYMQNRTCRYGNMSSYESSLFNRESSDKPIGVTHEEDASNFTNFSSSYNFPAAKVINGDPQNCSTWKSIGSQQNSCDWIGNGNYHSGGSAGIVGNTSQMFVGEDFSAASTVNNIKPSSYFASSYGNNNMLQFNTLQDVVTSATIGNHEVKMISFSQPTNIKETYSRDGGGGGGGGGSWTDVHQSFTSDRPLEGCSQWSNNPINKSFNRELKGNSSAQALSLTLSSLPASKLRLDREGTRNLSDHVHSNGELPDPKASSIPTINGDRLSVNSRQDMTGTSNVNHRNVGPLGPFTGYATILRSSKFLKPAQQLLDEFCFMSNQKSVENCLGSSQVLQNFGISSGDALKEEEHGGCVGDSGGSSSTFHSSNEKRQEGGGSKESFQPEYLQKKAKLLYMQEEICRRYKQYHQQMQMVVSSFESVAGLSASTPYISLALKTVSRHFKCLKNAIFDQLKNVGKALGEDFSHPTTHISTSKADASTSRLKFIDQTYQKHRLGGVGGTNISFEPQQQHVWRPQRGLPERAVTVLRAWLFDHFLHPYPTDADKHVLATQTGLTRNQVSNWFINARVRVWKPMVEEIHMLENKGVTVSCSSNGERIDNEKICNEGDKGTQDSQQSNKFSTDTQINSSNIGSSSIVRDRSNQDTWNFDKRLRVESHHPAPMDASLIGFMPYQRSGIEMGGLEAVSLTLGLRQSAEDGNQQQQLHQPERQFMQHFGEFVG